MHSSSIGSNSSFESYSYQYRSRSESTSQQVSQKRDVAEAKEVEKTEASSSRAENFNVSQLVDTLYSFTSSRVTEAQANGASEEEISALWDDALSGIEKGFGEAKDILEDMDLLDEDLEMKINSAYGQIVDKIEQQKSGEADVAAMVSDAIVDETAPESTEPAQAAATPVAADSDDNNGMQALNVNERLIDKLSDLPVVNGQTLSRGGRLDISSSYYQSQTFSLDIKTSEGDTIQIRSATEDSGYFESLSRGRSLSTQWTTESSSGYSLYIEGDLNEQELADLDALLADVNSLANEFYNGSLDTAFEMASSIGIDGSSLSSMNLSMREVESYGTTMYESNSPRSSRVPQGLEPLKEYAEKLIEQQQQWQERLNSREGLLSALMNHPRAQNDLGDFAKQVLA
ncbi:DUF5610 domain-containing protein [Reinekea marinisedimentorum]|uniref:DUF5610 domain-containing protein n=1 Tax=Reinekea marinisedimentorum TaxID=230495 RepID=A0A4R3IAD0_9GAMM|nr:DUF5610 domain-containing protein [Reinekea marinisedimentorum]TCS42439.1 hypothetical protein BCF53_103100 [Reinekea marinisedimentorum]